MGDAHRAPRYRRSQNVDGNSFTTPARVPPRPPRFTSSLFSSSTTTMRMAVGPCALPTESTPPSFRPAKSKHRDSVEGSKQPSDPPRGSPFRNPSNSEHRTSKWANVNPRPTPIHHGTHFPKARPDTRPVPTGTYIPQRSGSCSGRRWVCTPIALSSACHSSCH
ncbi:hypothetical protein C8Q76DRAFT_713522 [Earliella scabrosa]|nr:hypothetical protein C8Q76DRAFT_713522 [Earliella scabrosa]